MTLQNQMKHLNNKLFANCFEGTTNKLLVLLILTDFGFILGHILLRFDFLAGKQWNITTERGYAESFQYIQEIWITTTLFIYGIKTLALNYFSWSILYSYILLDDYFQIHERLGSDLVSLFNYHPAFGLRAQDIGETSVFTIFGVFFLVILLFSYKRSNLHTRNISNNLFFLLASLTVFGFIADMIHSVVDEVIGNDLLSLYFEIIEDGGEMLVMSIIVWYVLCINPVSYPSSYGHH